MSGALPIWISDLVIGFTFMRQFDLVIVGTTAPGIIAAIRAAREGLAVALVGDQAPLGGSFPSLGAIETHYRGNRAPLLQEFTDRLTEHYREVFGPDSPQHRQCVGEKMTTFEPHVARTVLERLVAAEERIAVFHGLRAVSVTQDERRIAAVKFERIGSAESLELAAAAFIEAGDLGDFLAVAGAQTRIGREARSEYLEPRAGKVFTQWLSGRFPRAACEGQLNLITAGATTSDPLPGSTGEGDENIQSYSYRLCLTDDPANQLLLTEPPEGYDRASFAPILLPVEEKHKLRLPFHHRFLIYNLREMVERDHVFHGHALPNRKRSWNATNLTEGSRHYPQARPSERREIELAHQRHALGLMWFLQNDSEVPTDIREIARRWGLAADEFKESGNFPPVIYAREGRRLVGRSVFTEHDALVAAGAQRAPVHADSVGITEFSLDSLACTMERLPDSLCDGQLFQMENSRPGQVPFGVLLAKHVDNLLAVSTVSATHVGWGTIRQTPTQMHLAESAAWAVILAQRRGIMPANLSVDELQRTLVSHGVMITFFNDFDMSTKEPWVEAIQYFGTKGEFVSYDAAPHISGSRYLRRFRQGL